MGFCGSLPPCWGIPPAVRDAVWARARRLAPRCRTGRLSRPGTGGIAGWGPARCGSACPACGGGGRRCGSAGIRATGRGAGQRPGGAPGCCGALSQRSAVRAAAGGPGAGVVAPAACGPYHAGDGRGPSFVPPRQPRPALNGRAHALTVCAPPLSVVSDTPVARIESVGDNQAASINGITLIEKFDENARSPAVGAVTGASRRCPGRMPLWVICAPVPCRRNRRGSCPVALPGGRSQLIRAGWRPRARAGLRRQAYILPGPGKLRMRRTSPRRGGRADGTRRLRPVRSALPATSSW